MEATNNKNQKRVNNRVANRVCFPNGEIRRPEYAVLLPNGHSVLCRAGYSLGLSAIISRREADRKGVNYLRPMRWDSSNLFVYPNNEVRNEKGKFVGTYMGQYQDDFHRPFDPNALGGGTIQDIFLQTEEGLYDVNFAGKAAKVDVIKVVLGRLSWSALHSISTRGDVAEVISALAEFDPAALRAALQLQELQKEQEERNQQLRSLDEELDTTPVPAPKKDKTLFFVSDEEE